MKRIVVIAMALGLLMSLTSLSLAEEGGSKYVGASKCKSCHKSEAKGDQFSQWEGSAHAKAYEALASEKAIEVGKKAGVENPQTSEKCLKCHVTAYGVAAEMKEESFVDTEGVGCESCHGPGSEYKKMKIMKVRDDAIAAGLIIPTAETCTGCHNEESPTFAGFDYDTYFAKISHPNPNKEAAE